MLKDRDFPEPKTTINEMFPRRTWEREYPEYSLRERLEINLERIVGRIRERGWPDLIFDPPKLPYRQMIAMASLLGIAAFLIASAWEEQRLSNSLTAAQIQNYKPPVSKVDLPDLKFP